MDYPDGPEVHEPLKAKEEGKRVSEMRQKRKLEICEAKDSTHCCWL